LVGFSHLSTTTTEFGAPLSFSDSSWGLALGGGLDIKLNDKFAIRALQVDYLRTHFFNETQTKGRISACSASDEEASEGKDLNQG
jgi:hypothetical protein